jgi:hypothetical protein
MPLTARVERGPSEAARSREHEGQPGSLPPLPCLQAPSLSLSNRAAWLISPCARPSKYICSFQACSFVPLGRAPLVDPTAAVERAHSDRARSVSKGPTGVSFRPFVLGCRACRR